MLPKVVYLKRRDESSTPFPSKQIGVSWKDRRVQVAGEKGENDFSFLRSWNGSGARAALQKSLKAQGCSSPWSQYTAAPMGGREHSGSADYPALSCILFEMQGCCMWLLHGTLKYFLHFCRKPTPALYNKVLLSWCGSAEEKSAEGKWDLSPPNLLKF